MARKSERKIAHSAKNAGRPDGPPCAARSYSALLRDSTMSIFFIFRWDMRLTRMEKPAVSAAAQR